MRRLATICILIGNLALAAQAQDDSQRAGIAAATDSAAQGLLDQIELSHIAPDLTVKDFLDRTGGRDELRAALAHSDPVGGPRWLDEQTCQISLEVSGTEVVADLANIAAHHPDRSPIPAMSLPRVADGLSALSFTATGASTSARVAPLPPPDSPWTRIAPDTRSRAFADACADAVRAVLTSVAAIQLTPGHPLAEAMSVDSVRHSLTDWLASRPVTAVEYRQLASGSLEVQVTLAADPHDFFDTLRAAVIAQGTLPTPLDAAGWADVRQQVLQGMAPAIGRAAPTAGAAAGGGGGGGGARITLPLQPPDWIRAMAEASGVGGPSINSLRAARAAEADAMDHLRQAVGKLPLTSDQTIAQAETADPHFAFAVDRAIARGARLYRSEYRPDGTVTVSVSLDLRFLWTSISGRP